MAAGDGSEQPIINVEGERVALGPLRRDLLPVYQRWYNDLLALHWLGSPVRPMTLEGETSWYDNESTESDPIGFTIYERLTGDFRPAAEPGWRAVGTCALFQIDYRHGAADLIIMIGEAERRGKGLGTEAVRLLLDYGFTALGLHNIKLAVDADNVRARRAYENAGFKEIGRRRQVIRGPGGRTDEIFMDCLATEFVSSVLGRVFVPDEPKG